MKTRVIIPGLVKHGRYRRFGDLLEIQREGRSEIFMMRACGEWLPVGDREADARAQIEGWEPDFSGKVCYTPYRVAMDSNSGYGDVFNVTESGGLDYWSCDEGYVYSWWDIHEHARRMTGE